MLAGLNYLYLTVFDRPWDAPRKGVLLMTDKIIAAGSLFLWVGILYLGRMLP